jgi:mannose-1-phosphate guanylyltransferase
MDSLYALIMAGGGGTRLWPLSRRNRPKQMLPLVEDRTMFQISVERLAPLLPPERIFVVTGADQVAALQASTPQVPLQNFIAEPFGMNTGPAVGLGTVHIQHRDPAAIIAVLTADQHIADKTRLRAVLAAAGELAQEGYLVTLGIKPDFPATGYGYIQRGAPLRQVGEFQAYRADRFTEKPDLETALAFLESGLYSWNSGMFIFQAGRIMTEYARQQPLLYALLRDIQAALGRPNYADVLREKWPQMPKISIDYAVMEGAQDMAVIPVDMGWSDVGSWETLYDEDTGLRQQARGDDRRGGFDHCGHGRHPLCLSSRPFAGCTRDR